MISRRQSSNNILINSTRQSVVNTRLPSAHQQHQKESISKNMNRVQSAVIKHPQTMKQQLIQLSKQNEDKTDFYQIIQTEYDKDMIKYRFKSKNPEHMRKEQIQRFIFDKKSKNILKYSTKSKINLTALPVPNGTISIMLNVGKKEFGFDVENYKKSIPPRSRFKMKWKTIEWLLVNRKDAIHQIFSNYNLLLKYAKSQQGGMNREQFGEFMGYVGLGADPKLADKLFYILDDMGNGFVDYKQLIIGLEVFKESALDEKIKVFFDLCESNKEGKILGREIMNILKSNILSKDDQVKLMKILHEMLKNLDPQNTGYVNRNELQQACTSHNQLRHLLNQNITNVKQIDKLIENDLEEPFHTWIPQASSMGRTKEGIHFGFVNNIMVALKETDIIQLKQEEYKNYVKGVIKDEDD